MPGWLSQLSVQAFGFSSGRDLMCHGTEPHLRLCAQQSLLEDSLPLPLCPLTLTLSQVNK